jgi:hypothetical protein
MKESGIFVSIVDQTLWIEIIKTEIPENTPGFCFFS